MKPAENDTTGLETGQYGRPSTVHRFVSSELEDGNQEHLVIQRNRLEPHVRKTGLLDH